jgi:hypothetical protein
MNEKYKNQRAYYWRHREQILEKNAKKAKDPEYRTHRNNIAIKSYYKRKEEHATENQI